MTLRFVSGVLWFISGWFVAGTIAINFGINQAVGPLVGIAWAVLVVVDPKDVVWRVGKGRSPAALPTAQRRSSDTTQLDAAA